MTASTLNGGLDAVDQPREGAAVLEEFFDLVRVRDAHARSRCRDLDGTEPWACCECDCTRRLEARLAGEGVGFLDGVREAAGR